MAIPRLEREAEALEDRTVLMQLTNPYTLIEEKQRQDNTIRELKARYRLGNVGPQTQAEEDFFGGHMVSANMKQDVVYLHHDHPEASHPGTKLLLVQTRRGRMRVHSKVYSVRNGQSCGSTD